MSACASALGNELVAATRAMAASEFAWLQLLVEFDQSQLWLDDGSSCCAAWLVFNCDLGLSTAKEKLRVAHELERRPIVAAAFDAGDIGYAKARVLTRLYGCDDDRDVEWVATALQLTADKLDRYVRHYNRAHEPDRPPEQDHRRMYRQRGCLGGMGRLIFEAPEDELDRVESVVDAYGDYLFWNARREPVDKAPEEPPVLRPVDATTAAASPAPYDDRDPFAESDRQPVDKAPEEPPVEIRSLGERRFDWFLDLIEEIALVRDDQIDPERAAVGVIVQYETLVERAPGGAELESGLVIGGETARRLACDCGISRIITNGVSEILDTGRKTKTWNRAQRRAIRFRHNHRCTFPGCDHRITQIHHCEWWENGGVTSVANGLPLCAHHHHLVHEGGWKVTWHQPTGITTFTAPDGRQLHTPGRLPIAA